MFTKYKEEFDRTQWENTRYSGSDVPVALIDSRSVHL